MEMTLKSCTRVLVEAVKERKMAVKRRHNCPVITAKKETNKKTPALISNVGMWKEKKCGKIWIWCTTNDSHLFPSFPQVGHIIRNGLGEELETSQLRLKGSQFLHLFNLTKRLQSFIYWTCLDAVTSASSFSLLSHSSSCAALSVTVWTDG